MESKNTAAFKHTHECGKCHPCSLCLYPDCLCMEECWPIRSMDHLGCYFMHLALELAFGIGSGKLVKAREAVQAGSCDCCCANR